MSCACCRARSRRDFISTTSVVTAGLLADRRLILASPAPKPRIRVIYALHAEQQEGPDWPNKGFDFRPVMARVNEALTRGEVPLREFMLKQTREEDLALVTRAADKPNPESPEKVEMTTLIPAFMLSELRSAFIIGFVIFVPFLVIDLVVAAVLTALGMIMLPPQLVSLPLKLLLFVTVDGWHLLVGSLIGSF